MQNVVAVVMLVTNKPSSHYHDSVVAVSSLFFGSDLMIIHVEKSNCCSNGNISNMLGRKTLNYFFINICSC